VPPLDAQRSRAISGTNRRSVTCLVVDADSVGKRQAPSIADTGRVRRECLQPVARNNCSSFTLRSSPAAL
jgi:hypothetical protein